MAGRGTELRSIITRVSDEQSIHVASVYPPPSCTGSVGLVSFDDNPRVLDGIESV